VSFGNIKAQIWRLGGSDLGMYIPNSEPPSPKCEIMATHFFSSERLVLEGYSEAVAPAIKCLGEPVHEER
jgi:hypothetical protein